MAQIDATCAFLRAFIASPSFPALLEYVAAPGADLDELLLRTGELAERTTPDTASYICHLAQELRHLADHLERHPADMQTLTAHAVGVLLIQTALSLVVVGALPEDK